MKALVTGGAGFIGSNVVRKLLNEGWEARILDNLSTGYIDNLDGLAVEMVQGDILDASTVNSVGGYRRSVSSCSVSWQTKKYRLSSAGFNN